MKQLVVLLLGVLLGLPAVAFSETGTEGEALRQLEFAQAELNLSNYQKALNSAESALRLHPPLYEALAYKAIALEGLGDFRVAESMLVTYREIRGGWDLFPAGEHALERVRGKLGARTAELEALAALPAFDDVSELDTMPQFPDGSDEFLQWLVLRQQIDNAKSRQQIGGGLTASGIGLLVAGGLITGISSGLSVSSPNDSNIEAFYAAGLGSLFAGGALTVAGLPVAISGVTRLARLKKGGVASKQEAWLEGTPTGLALRF